MRLLSIVSILLLLTVIVKATTKHYDVSWEGGHCYICEDCGDYDDDDDCWHNYACSNDHGDWNDGHKVFVDTVPPGKIVTHVRVTLHGLWDCTWPYDTGSDVTVSLQGHEIETRHLEGQCLCQSCDTVEVFEWDGAGACFPDYNYGTGNLLDIDVHSNTICVKSAEIDVTYEHGDPGFCGDLIPSCDDFGGCGDHGYCEVDTTSMTAECICDEEWYGPNCQCYVPSEHLETTHPPILDVDKSGFETKDTLHLYFNDSVKYFDTKVTFKNSLSDTCDYPDADGPVVWTSSFDPDNCVYIYHGTIPWDVAWPTCVFERVEEDNWIIFTGEMIVEHKEDLGPLRSDSTEHIIRTLIHRLPFQVRFPKSIGLHIELMTISAPVDIVASITKQEFISDVPSLPGTGDIHLLTSVQWPYQLTGPIEIVGDTSKYLLSVTGPTGSGGPDCLDDGSECLQLWNIKVLPFLDQCDFDDDYQFKFGVKCKPSQLGDCPLDEDTNSGFIDFILDSEYFCPEIIETIDLTGTLNAFKDYDTLILKHNYLMGQTVYFKARAESEMATIIDTTISEIEIALWNGDHVLLYDGTNTIPGDLIDLVVEDNYGDDEESLFHWVFKPEVFPVSYDQNEDFSVWIILDVTFKNTQEKRSRRYELVILPRSEENSQQIETFESFNLENNGSYERDNEENIESSAVAVKAPTIYRLLNNLI